MRPRAFLALAVALAAVALAVPACSGDGDGGGSGGDAAGERLGGAAATAVATGAGAPSAYDRALCDLVYEWRGVLSEGVERLSREGVPREPPERHELAVAVVDDLVAATQAFAGDVRALEPPPDEAIATVVEREVDAGLAAAVEELERVRDGFAGLSDADFEPLVLRGAEMASGLEKASSRLTQRLEALATEHGVTGPDEICGTGRLVD